MSAYAGIGSRETPEPYCRKFRDVARQLAMMNWKLRSGAAEGADNAFELGCDDGAGAKEIFLPWRSFNGSRSSLWPPTAEALALAELAHPAWWRCSHRARLLLGRNSHQILGAQLASPVRMIVCWTPGGAMVGGTAQALRVAALRAPLARIFNAGAVSVDDGPWWAALLTWARGLAGT